MKAKLLLLAVVAAGAFALPGTARAATVIDGHCRTHLGTLLIRNSGGSTYKFRIGPRDGHSTGDFVCQGVHKVKSGRANSVSGWLSFNLGSWNWHGTVTFTKTAIELGGACVAFGGAFIGEVPSGGFDTAITGASGLACADGVHTLWSQIPASPDNAPVRIIK